MGDCGHIKAEHILFVGSVVVGLPARVWSPSRPGTHQARPPVLCVRFLDVPDCIICVLISLFVRDVVNAEASAIILVALWPMKLDSVHKVRLCIASDGHVATSAASAKLESFRQRCVQSKDGQGSLTDCNATQ